MNLKLLMVNRMARRLSYCMLIDIIIVFKQVMKHLSLSLITNDRDRGAYIYTYYIIPRLIIIVLLHIQILIH